MQSALYPTRSGFYFLNFSPRISVCVCAVWVRLKRDVYYCALYFSHFWFSPVYVYWTRIYLHVNRNTNTNNSLSLRSARIALQRDVNKWTHSFLCRKMHRWIYTGAMPTQIAREDYSSGGWESARGRGRKRITRAHQHIVIIDTSVNVKHTNTYTHGEYAQKRSAMGKFQNGSCAVSTTSSGNATPQLGWIFPTMAYLWQLWHFVNFDGCAT